MMVKKKNKDIKGKIRIHGQKEDAGAESKVECRNKEDEDRRERK